MNFHISIETSKFACSIKLTQLSFDAPCVGTCVCVWMYKAKGCSYPSSCRLIHKIPIRRSSRLYPPIFEHEWWVNKFRYFCSTGTTAGVFCRTPNCYWIPNDPQVKSATKAFAHFTDDASKGCFPNTTTLCTGRDPPVFWRASKSLVWPY